MESGGVATLRGGEGMADDWELREEGHEEDDRYPLSLFSNTAGRGACVGRNCMADVIKSSTLASYLTLYHVMRGRMCVCVCVCVCV